MCLRSSLFCGISVVKGEIRKLKDDIKEKNEQIALLGKQIEDSIIPSHTKMNSLEMSQVSFLLPQLDWLYHVVDGVPPPYMCSFSY